MGKFINFLLSDSWEEYKRIQLFEKIGKSVEKEKIELNNVFKEI